MQKIVFLLLVICSGTKAFSQQEFFVYFQADNHQPFYARINTKIFSSSETGYMIIPKLSDSTYEVVIGFAQKAFPEQVFSVPVNKKDKGFQLKNLGEKGWALVNLQNMSVIMNSSVSEKPVQEEMTGVRKTDAFSVLLANVVNDTSILYTAVKTKAAEPVVEKPAVAIKEVEKPQEKEVTSTTKVIEQPSNKDVVKKDAAASTRKKGAKEPKLNAKDSLAKVNDSSVVTSAVKIEPRSIEKDSATREVAGTEKPFITRIEEKKSPDMYQATYLEQYILTTDTIKITIPLTDSEPQGPVSLPTSIEKKPDTIANQKNVAEEKSTPEKSVVVDTTSRNRAIVIMNSDCKNFASDYDVDKLRVKLISDQTIDDKLATSKKYFKNKCLSVKQISALAELFPSDETKYRFFDLSYPFVSDTSNFYSLEELIENNYYKNRFKAMLIK